MESLHPALLPSLALLPDDCPVALLTRHSVREQGNGAFAGYDLPLTPAGIALAESWGARLGRPLHAVASSPVPRCVDTAAAMLRGAGVTGLPVVTDQQLMEPGCFVSDMRAVGRLFLSLGPVAFVSRHLGDPLPGLLAPTAGTARLLCFLRERLGAPGSLSLLVTHDTILAAAMYTLLGRTQIVEEDWPWMMEGAFLWFEGDQVCWLWRGERGGRSLAALDAS